MIIWITEHVRKFEFYKNLIRYNIKVLPPSLMEIIKKKNPRLVFYFIDTTWIYISVFTPNEVSFNTIIFIFPYRNLFISSKSDVFLFQNNLFKYYIFTLSRASSVPQQYSSRYPSLYIISSGDSVLVV